MLPVPAGDDACTLRGGPEGLRLHVEGALPGMRKDGLRAALVTWGKDPLGLIECSVAYLAAELKSFRLRTQKPSPRFSDYLGWCTWNAFMFSVDEAKIMAGLRSFARGGVPLGFLLIDDGWFDAEGLYYLRSMSEKQEKFPGGLAGLVRAARDKFGVRQVGVWHALAGYWGGVQPSGPIGKEHRLVHNRANVRPWDKTGPARVHLIHPDEAARFYHVFYRWLRGAGISMVKVDAQGWLEYFTEGKLGRVGTMRAYQEAMQGAAAVHMAGEVVHCMSNGSDVAYHMAATSGWRNSIDYLPHEGAEVQQRHVYLNAYNALWSSQFAQPDWDMFQSHGPMPLYHAVARAISGGPVYVTDLPGKQDFALLRRLCTSDGRSLRCQEPALPSDDCIFADPMAEPVPLKAVNRHLGIGVLGAFHCCPGERPARGAFRPADVRGIRPARRYAVLDQLSGTVRTATPRGRIKLELAPRSCALYTISPVEGGVAPLGLLDKLNGAAAIEQWGTDSAGCMTCTLRDGGRVGFYCERRPAQVRVNGRRVRGRYDQTSGLLVLRAPLGRACAVTVEMP